MNERIGESLKKVVFGSGSKAPRQSPGNLFSNECRMACYRAALELALARTGLIAASARRNRGACAWQLEALVREGMLDAWRVGGRLHYSPAKAVADDGMASMLSRAFGKTEHRLLLEALARPGCESKAAASTVRGLEDLKLISVVTDGRFKRLHPGEKLSGLSDELARGFASHRAAVQRAMHDRGITFELNPLRGGATEIRLGTGGDAHAFTIPSDPFNVALSARAQLYNFL